MDAKLTKVVAFPVTKESSVGLSANHDKEIRLVAEEIMQRTGTQALLNEIKTDDNVRHVTVYTIDETVCNQILYVFKASDITPVVNCNFKKMALTKISLIDVISAFEKMAIEIDFRCSDALDDC